MQKLIYIIALCTTPSIMSMESSDPCVVQSNDQQLTLNRKLIKNVELNKKEKVQELIDKGANVNACDNRGTPVLVHAASVGNKEMCRILLACRANVNAQCTSGYTALMEAAMHNHQDICLILLEYGAQLDMQSSNGHTALLNAIFYAGTRALCELLITYSHFTPCYANEELADAKQRTLVRLCCLNRAFPQLPNEIKELILQADTSVWYDAYASLIGIRAGSYRHLPNLPYCVTRRLVDNQQLDLDEAVKTLTNHKYAQLKPILLATSREIQDVNTEEMRNIKQLLDTNAVDIKPAIAQEIRRLCTPEKNLKK